MGASMNHSVAGHRSVTVFFARRRHLRLCDLRHWRGARSASTARDADGRKRRSETYVADVVGAEPRGRERDEGRDHGPDGGRGLTRDDRRGPTQDERRDRERDELTKVDRYAPFSRWRPREY